MKCVATDLVLPEEGVEVLWFSPGGKGVKAQQFTGYRDGNNVNWGGDLDMTIDVGTGKNVPITHWQPLPLPPPLHHSRFQKVAEDAYHAWENFMRQVCRMQRRMLTQMAEKIDRQWADMVAETPEQRHDAATCCGERQGTECRPEDAGADETSQADVGDEWRDLGPEEFIHPGDEVLMEGIWQESFCGGDYVGQRHERYRRRVTPEAPLGACLDEENNELREQVATLTAEVERLRREVKYLNEKQQARAEALLTADLEREGIRVAQLQRDWRQIVAERNADNARLTAEVERLRKLVEKRGGGE